MTEVETSKVKNFSVVFDEFYISTVSKDIRNNMLQKYFNEFTCERIVLRGA